MSTSATTSPRWQTDIGEQSPITHKRCHGCEEFIYLGHFAPCPSNTDKLADYCNHCVKVMCMQQRECPNCD